MLQKHPCAHNLDLTNVNIYLFASYVLRNETIEKWKSLLKPILLSPLPEETIILHLVWFLSIHIIILLLHI